MTNKMFSPVWSTGITAGPASQNVPPQALASLGARTSAAVAEASEIANRCKLLRNVVEAIVVGAGVKGAVVKGEIVKGAIIKGAIVKGTIVSATVG